MVELLKYVVLKRAVLNISPSIISTFVVDIGFDKSMSS